MIFTINFADNRDAYIDLNVPECFRYLHAPKPDRLYRNLFDNIGWCRYGDLQGEEAADELEAVITAVTQPEAWKEYYPEVCLMDNDSIAEVKRNLAVNRRAWFRQKSKWKSGLEHPTLDYHIIASGSEGNAVRVGNILFDCGIPFRKLKEDLYLVDYLLITHDHQDHVKPATLKSIVREFPNIRIYSTYRVARMNDSVVPINLDYLPIELGDKLVYAVEVPHDVVTYGYIVQGPDTAYVYATDLSDTKSLTEVCQGLGARFDAVFLEANYDPEKLRALGSEWRGHYNPYLDSTNRHLSVDESALFYARFKKEGGEYIELHKSHRFY